MMITIGWSGVREPRISAASLQSKHHQAQIEKALQYTSLPQERQAPRRQKLQTFGFRLRVRDIHIGNVSESFTQAQTPFVFETLLASLRTYKMGSALSCFAK